MPETLESPIELKRDVEASLVPSGMRVTLHKGEQAQVTQSLGGSFTVIVQGNMFRIERGDADALGIQPEESSAPHVPPGPVNEEQLKEQVWAELKNVYDPEIPVNIVDLGLIYDCHLTPQADGGTYRADVKMTLTAPGCGMGPILQQEVSNRLMGMPGIDTAEVELVWDPPWNQGMMSEAAKLQLGLY